MDERGYRIWLSGMRGMDFARYTRLIERFGSAEQVFFDQGHARLEAAGMPQEMAAQIHACRDERMMDDLMRGIEKSGARCILYDDAEYPALYRMIGQPPPILYCRGEPPKDVPCVAIVGTRRCTGYGQRAAEDIAGALSSEGVCVVSGMAAGIDTCAHRGALHAGGRTIAVLGCGIDVVYPKENWRLHERIPESGALFTEYPPGMPGLKHNFPHRNRLISGLCCAVVVVEGDLNSGAQHTANCALEQGRLLAAVPGSIYSRMSNLPNRLIEEGAAPLCHPGDILSLLGWQASPQKIPEGQPQKYTDEERKLLRCIADDGSTREELQKNTGFSAKQLNILLTILETGEIIKHVLGDRFVRVRQIDG